MNLCEVKVRGSALLCSDFIHCTHWKSAVSFFLVLSLYYALLHFFLNGFSNIFILVAEDPVWDDSWFPFLLPAGASMVTV